MIDMLRWIAFLPSAFAAGVLAGIVVNLLGQFSLGYVGLTPDDFLGQLYFVTSSSAATGAAFVYCGARVAPAKRLYVAFILGGVGLVWTGLTLFYALHAMTWWDVWGIVSTTIGIGGVLFSIHKGDIELSK